LVDNLKKIRSETFESYTEEDKIQHRKTQNATQHLQRRF